MKHSEVKIRFDETEHRYWDEATGTEFLSATSFLKRFHNPFDEQFHSLRIALKRGVPQEQVLAEWAGKAESARTKGTETHGRIEAFLKRGERHPDSAVLLDALDSLIKSHSDVEVLSERILFDAESLLCGTIDMAFIYRATRMAQPFDFKTDKGGISRQDWGRNMLGPLCHLPDSPFMHHALQTSLYAWFLEKHWKGSRILPGAILHVNTETQEMKAVPVPYLKQEIEAVVSFRVAELSQQKTACR